MSRYIKVEDLYKKTIAKNTIWLHITNAEGKNLKEIVEDLPTYSVPEKEFSIVVREKGEWIFDGFCGCFGYDNNCKCHCSNCNKKIIVDGVYIVGEGYRMNPEGITPNFCSNCGADMRGCQE